MKELKIALNSKNEWIEKILNEKEHCDDYIAALIDMDTQINGTDQIYAVYENEELFRNKMRQASEKEVNKTFEITLNEAYELVTQIYECVPENSKLGWNNPDEMTRNIPEDDLIETLVMNVERLKILFNLLNKKGE